jgi:hypothetical protein
MTNIPPAGGWYRDPTGRYNIRYWDGRQWTHHVNSGGVNSTDPVAADMASIPPTPGTEASATPPAPVAQQPTMQITQQAPRSSAGTVVAVVLSLIAVAVVVIVLLSQSGDDDSTTTTVPDTTGAPAQTEAPATTAPPSDG